MTRVSRLTSGHCVTRWNVFSEDDSCCDLLLNFCCHSATYYFPKLKFTRDVRGTTIAVCHNSFVCRWLEPTTGVGNRSKWKVTEFSNCPQVQPTVQLMWHVMLLNMTPCILNEVILAHWRQFHHIFPSRWRQIRLHFVLYLENLIPCIQMEKVLKYIFCRRVDLLYNLKFFASWIVTRLCWHASNLCSAY